MTYRSLFKLVLEVVANLTGIPGVVKWVVAYLTEKLDMVPDEKLKLTADKALAAPDEVRTLLDELFEVVDTVFADYPLLSKGVKALAKFVSGYLLDKVWDRLVHEGEVVTDGPIKMMAIDAPSYGVGLHNFVDELQQASV